MVTDILKHLGLQHKTEGKNVKICCLNCDDDGFHLSLLAETGHGHCLKCDWRANLYKIAQAVTTMQPREIFELLERYGFGGDKNWQKEQKKAAPEITRDDIRAATSAELLELAKAKAINATALVKFEPWAHAKHPRMLLPGFNPTDTAKAVGWMQIRFDGKPVYDFTDPATNERKVIKYPIISGSNHGILGARTVLKDNPDTLLFCEGWRDALAAIGIGYAAVASTGGASTWNDDWLPLFKDRTVYVLMDQDKAGQRAADRAAAAIARVAKQTFIARLPYELKDSHGEDLHDYIVRDGHNATDVAELLKGSSECKIEQTDTCEKQAGGEPRATAGDFCQLQSDDPDYVAEQFRNWELAQEQVEHRYNAIDGWSLYRHRKNQYKRIADENEIRIWFRKYLSECKIKVDKKGGSKWEDPKKLKTKATITTLIEALQSRNDVHLDPERPAPCSLTAKFNPQKVIALRNCAIDLTTNPPTMMELSPDIYTFNYLPFDYDAKAACPEWIRFLNTIFTTKTLGEGTEWDQDRGDFVLKYIEAPDKLAAEILQEWFGYFIVPQTHLQKIFCIIGLPRSGKGTISKVLEQILGPKNVSHPTLTSLTTNFGLQALLNTTLAIIGDAHLGGKNANTASAVEILKGISGEDAQQIDRKMKSHINVRLPVRFLMMANKIQDLRDSSGALANRFNFLITSKSFLGCEDTDLEAKLMAELPGIFNWAVQGYYRLTARKRLIEHPAGIETKEEFEELSSPIKSFIKECCTVAADQMVPVEILWKINSRWMERNGQSPYHRQRFVIEIQSGIGGLQKKRARVSDDKWDEYGWNKDGTKVGTNPDNESLEYCFYGINLNNHGKEILKQVGTVGTAGTRLEQNKSLERKDLW